MTFTNKSIFVLALLFAPAASTAGAPPNVFEIDSIDGDATSVTALHTLTDAGRAGATVLHLASYHCASGRPCSPDGGQGLLVLYDPSEQCHFGLSGPGKPEDGGSFFADASNHCWYRQNLNGDLRQWGMTQDSDYDAIYVLNHPGDTLLTATDIINTAFTALGKVGITRLHTKQVNLKIDLGPSTLARLTITAGGSLTCDAPPVKNALDADYTHIRGSLIVAHQSGGTNFIDASTYNDAEVYGCAAIIPEWYINPSLAPTQFGGYAFTRPDQAGFAYKDLEAIRANMILAGDTAIVAGAGAKIHDLSILGFDNCLHSTKGPGTLIKNIAMDCSIGVYMNHNLGASTVKDLDANPRLTKQAGNPQIDNEEAWDIYGIAASPSVNQAGRPLCRITLKKAGGGGAHDLTDLQQSAVIGRGDPAYFPLWISGPSAAGKSCTSASTGAFGNDAAWAIGTIVSTGSTVQFDLLGSDYASPSGPSGGIPSSATWLANTGILRIAGPIANLVSGMQVTSQDANWPGCPSACAQLSVVTVLQRATGPDPNDGYNGYVVVSAPPQLANSGGDTPAVVTFSNTSAAYVDNAPCTVDANNQASGNCAYVNAAERYVAGNSEAGQSSARLPSSRGGHLAAGVLLDDVAGLRAINVDTYGHYYNIATIDAEECDFDQIKGDDNGELNPGNTTGVYVTGDSRSCVFDSEGPGKPAAALVADTFGTADQLPSIGATMGFSGPTATGTLQVTSGTTGGWPSRGELHICAQSNCPKGSDNEYAAYTTAPGSSTISVTVRGRFGTAPVNWSSGAPVTVFWTEINNGSSTHPGKSGTTSFVNLNTPSTTSPGEAFEVHHGAATLTNLNTQVNGVGFVSTNTAGVSLSSVGLPKVAMYFEDGNARKLTTVSADSQLANFVPPGLTNLPMTLLNPGGATLHAVGFSGLGANGVGELTVNGGDMTTWPQTGVLAVDSEEMAFALSTADDTHIEVTQRGACGTAPASHTDSYIKFLLVELPCGGGAGLKGYGDNGFAIGSPTGGSEGAGSLNAQAVYRNGAPLGAANWASGTTATQVANTTSYYPCQGYTASAALTEAQANSLAGVSGTIKNLRVLLGTMPGAGHTMTVTVRIAGVTTGLACTVSGTATTCSDVSDSDAVTAGQTCSIQAVSSSGAASTRVFAATEFDN